jgi:hypothetical protein
LKIASHPNSYFKCSLQKFKKKKKEQNFIILFYHLTLEQPINKSPPLTKTVQITAAIKLKILDFVID